MQRRLPNSAGCFVCGSANPRGLGVRFEVENGVVTTRFVPHRDHCGYNDRVHGGVMAALLDEVMGWAPSVIKRRLWEARGEIADEAGTVYARGTGKYHPLSDAETQAVMEYLAVDGKTVTLEETLAAPSPDSES